MQCKTQFLDLGTALFLSLSASAHFLLQIHYFVYVKMKRGRKKEKDALLLSMETSKVFIFLVIYWMREFLV